MGLFGVAYVVCLTLFAACCFRLWGDLIVCLFWVGCFMGSFGGFALFVDCCCCLFC